MKKQRKRYLLVALAIIGLFLFASCRGGTQEYKPIEGWNGILDILVWPIAALMWAIGKTVGFGYYGLVIIIATIIVRTLAWPIYAKTNDMSLKMQLMAPTKQKLKKNTETKTTPKASKENNWN